MSSFRITLLTPKDEPERAGFTKTGYLTCAGSTSAPAATTRNSGVRIAGASRHHEGEGLVHAQRRALDIATHVRDPGELEETLDGPVFAELAVQNRKDNVESDGLVLAALQNDQSMYVPVWRQARWS